MTIEEMGMRAIGLDPAKVNAIIADAAHFTEVGKAQIATITALVADIEKALAVIKTETPRAAKMLANIESQIKAYQANQARFGGGR